MHRRRRHRKCSRQEKTKEVKVASSSSSAASSSSSAAAVKKKKEKKVEARSSRQLEARCRSAPQEERKQTQAAGQGVAGALQHRRGAGRTAGGSEGAEATLQGAAEEAQAAQWKAAQED